MEISFKKLKDSPYRPRIHPNGFIQLDISDNLRLHVWVKEPLAKRKVDTPIHDHPFGFDSFVIYGQIGNVIYDVLPSTNGTYNVYQVMPYTTIREDAPLERDKSSYELQRTKEFWTNEGERYHLEPYVFHETKISDLSATIIRVAPFDSRIPARVLCHSSMSPDRLFDRYAVDQSVLWGVIEEVLDHAHYKGFLRIPDL